MNTFITIDLSDFNLNKACRSLRHKLSLACLFVSSELLFNVLIDSSKYLSLSKRNLTESEIKLLKNRLKFTPTPNEDKTMYVVPFR
jgi:hypothetical protein